MTRLVVGIMSVPVSTDHSGYPAFKLVVHGPTGVGKTTVLRVLGALKKIEDPPKLASELASIGAPSGETLFFDKITFHAGEFDLEKGSGVRLHVWATAGAKHHVQQRKITMEGADGIVLLLSPFKNDFRENQEVIDEVSTFLPKLPLQILINKADSVSSQELQETAQRIVVYAGDKGLRSIESPIAVSVLYATRDLLALLNSPDVYQCLTAEKRLKRECRPESMDLIAKGFRLVAYQAIIDRLRHSSSASSK